MVCGGVWGVGGGCVVSVRDGGGGSVRGVSPRPGSVSAPCA